MKPLLSLLAALLLAQGGALAGIAGAPRSDTAVRPPVRRARPAPAVRPTTVSPVRIRPARIFHAHNLARLPVGARSLGRMHPLLAAFRPRETYAQRLQREFSDRPAAPQLEWYVC